MPLLPADFTQPSLQIILRINLDGTLMLGLPFQRKAIIVSDAAIEIGFHRVVPPIPQPVPGRS